MTDEYARLLTFQQQLENETDGKIKYFGLSVNETIRSCVLNGFSKRADKVKSDFKVPDKRFVTLALSTACGVMVLFYTAIGFGILNCTLSRKQRISRVLTRSPSQSVVR
jgi:hypothetical protein